MGENTVAPHRAWPHETIDQAVRRRARDRPTEIAVVGPALTLTWQELDEAADRTAHLLAERGVGPGSLVGWFGQNDIGYPVVLLAAWRRRAGMVGMNWRLPDHDLRAVCEQIGLTHCVSTPELADRTAKIAQDMFSFSVMAQDLPPWVERPRAEALEPQADDLAMLFFTSGSTGVPKAVPLNRLSNELTVANPNGHGISAGSRQLIVPPVFHLAGAIWVQYGLLYGTTQVFISDASPQSIIEALARYEITHAVFVPTLIRAIVDRMGVEPVPIPTFQHLAYGASPITQALLREAMEVLDCEFCQVFGMTEIGGTVSFLLPEDHILSGKNSGRLASAGRPAKDVEVRVCDLVTGEELPPGRSGELWVRAPFMSDGYLGHPRATEAVFRDGWLNTRDIGHLDADGYLYVEGRSDDMIVTGGENVHPGEVENVIAQLPQVVECAVYGAPDDKWGLRVSAAVVVRTPDLTEADIDAHCREQLAGYKCPKEIRLVSALPRTPTGKIIRKQLHQKSTPVSEAGT